MVGDTEGGAWSGGSENTHAHKNSPEGLMQFCMIFIIPIICGMTFNYAYGVEEIKWVQQAEGPESGGLPPLRAPISAWNWGRQLVGPLVASSPTGDFEVAMSG